MRQRRSLAPRAELALLIECSKSFVEDSGLARIASLAAGPVDWDHLLDLAQEHGVAPLLNRRLQGIGRIPSAWLSRLRLLCEGNAFVTLSMVAELFRVLRILQAGGIQAIPYKGPALAVQAYGDIGLRIFSDLDLVLRHRDVMRACNLLIDACYRPEFSMALAASGRIPGQYVFRREGSRIPIEIHTEKTLRYFPRRLDLDAMTQRIQGVSLGGQEMFTFAMEDLVVMLCVHGSKHFWDHLLWIADIAALANRPVTIDWLETLSRARPLGAERMVLLGLCLAESMLDARFPREITTRIQTDRVTNSLAENIRARYFSEEHAPSAILQRAKFRILMRGNLLGAISYFLRLTTATTEEDWDDPASTSAPAKKVAWRPIRLLRKYGYRVKRN